MARKRVSRTPILGSRSPIYGANGRPRAPAPGLWRGSCLNRGLLPPRRKDFESRGAGIPIFAGICWRGSGLRAHRERSFPWTQAATQPSNEFDCLGLASQKHIERSHGITVVSRDLSIAKRRPRIKLAGCFSRRAWHARIHQQPFLWVLPRSGLLEPNAAADRGRMFAF